MNHPSIYVVDLRHDRQQPDTLSRFDERCVAGQTRGGDDIGYAIGTRRFQALCFEYDYPDIPSLRLLKETKLAWPSVPVLMITREHSEALAVWALRTGVWDYFVDPVPAAELRSCLDALAQLPLHDPCSGRRRMLKRFCSLPPEARFRDISDLMDDIDLDRASDYIQRNLSRKISQAEIARECHMSTWQFSRQFKRCFGVTFQDYVQQRRMQEARKLLQNPSASVTDVCYAVGFVDPSYFSRVFRQSIGVSPSSYKGQVDRAQGV